MLYPLEDEDWNTLGDLSSRLRSTYSQSHFGSLLDLPYTKWSAEGFDLAVEYSYKGIEEGSRPSSEYLERGQTLAEEQITKGGYRLARLLKKIWPNLAEAESELFLN